MPYQFKHNRRWTDKEDATIVAALRNGTPAWSVGESLSRSARAVKARARVLRLTNSNLPFFKREDGKPASFFNKPVSLFRFVLQRRTALGTIVVRSDNEDHALAAARGYKAMTDLS